MTALPPSSRQRYAEYRRQVRQKRRDRSAPRTVALPMSQERSIARQRSFPTLFLEFLRQLRGHRTLLAFGLIVSSVSTTLALVPLYGTKLVFDNVLGGKPLSLTTPAWLPLPSHPPSLLWTVTLSMAVIALVSLLLSMWSRWQATRISKRVQMAVRRRVFDHAVRLPLHRVYQIKSGGVASILREDAGSVGELVFAMLHNPWKAMVQLVGSLVILTWTDWRLLLASIGLLPLVFLTHRTWISRIRPLYRDIRATRQHIDSHATEAFGGIRIVRGFSRQRSEAERFILANHLMARQELAAWWWSRGIDIAWSIIIPVASAMLLLYGGLQIMRDADLVRAGALEPGKAFTIGDLVMFLAYLGSLLNPLATLANSATGFQAGLAGLDRVLDLMQEPADLPSRPGAVEVPRHQAMGRITLHDVAFTYANAPEPVLSAVNLDVHPGQMVALVGPSGAGKTTLCNLVARFYDPTAGRIELDGRDLRDIDTDSYRRLLGIVEQDIFLFDGSVADNIGYSRRRVSRSAVIDAARLAHADEFIRQLPQGYDTLIGERGVRLSGGQRQRIAIARALLADPRILILDEATSNLDTESERLIQASLQTLMAGRTSFVIAHRLSTIAHAHWIVVLEKGRVVEQGTHDQLIQRSGRYRDMVELQTRPPAPVESIPPADAAPAPTAT